MPKGKIWGHKTVGLAEAKWVEEEGESILVSLEQVRRSVWRTSGRALFGGGRGAAIRRPSDAPLRRADTGFFNRMEIIEQERSDGFCVNVAVFFPSLCLSKISMCPVAPSSSFWTENTSPSKCVSNPRLFCATTFSFLMVVDIVISTFETDDTISSVSKVLLFPVTFDMPENCSQQRGTSKQHAILLLDGNSS